MLIQTATDGVVMVSDREIERVTFVSRHVVSMVIAECQREIVGFGVVRSGSDGVQWLDQKQAVTIAAKLNNAILGEVMTAFEDASRIAATVSTAPETTEQLIARALVASEGVRSAIEKDKQAALAIVAQQSQQIALDAPRLIEHELLIATGDCIQIGDFANELGVDINNSRRRTGLFQYFIDRGFTKSGRDGLERNKAKAGAVKSGLFVNRDAKCSDGVSRNVAMVTPLGRTSLVEDIVEYFGNKRNAR
ncbi:MAG: hypothetical protein JRJ85_19845 [Deltaproteobacteria bacterium]|nr:hypothetical protein [Deltaproteobacteria bacterium]